MNSDGRPPYVPNIYKHGRLKTGEELEKEKKRIMDLGFDKFLNECGPISAKTVDYLKELVEGVKIDLYESLDQKGE